MTLCVVSDIVVALVKGVCCSDGVAFIVSFIMVDCCVGMIVL